MALDSALTMKITGLLERSPVRRQDRPEAISQPPHGLAIMNPKPLLRQVACASSGGGLTAKWVDLGW